jgi:hypothetical protein
VSIMNDDVQVSPVIGFLFYGFAVLLTVLDKRIGPVWKRPPDSSTRPLGGRAAE